MFRQISSWLIDADGCIRGYTTRTDGTETRVRTSLVQSREGNVVTTRSGSHYELVDPPHWIMTNPVELKNRFGGATDPLKAVDYRIAHHDS